MPTRTTNAELDLFLPLREDPFEKFHRENPQVYSEIVRLARLAKAKGREHWSINGIFEVLRWSRMVTHGDDFKLNNDFRAVYARMVMRREPELEGFFEVRKRKAG
jgi:hypothetical protein